VTGIRNALVGWQAAGKAPRSSQKGRPTIGSYRVEQRQVNYRGRVFHFVSYDGQPANVARGEAGSAASWFLMSAGTRWEVAPQLAGEDPVETDRRLLEWLERTISTSPQQGGQ
jgi:hypothetical protein